MDQRVYSALSTSTEQDRSLQPLASRGPESDLAKPSLVALCTGMDGAPDTTDSVDTEVIETIKPAVVHEHVQPVQHTKIEHKITREIHTHDVYHRILPVIETEVLPPRHFIDDGESLREVPASEVGKYTLTGAPGYRHPRARTTDPACEPRAERARAPPVAPPPPRAPLLAQKRTVMTEGGYPRTEYLWLHPPVFEDALGRTQPVAIPAGLSSAWKARLGVADRPTEPTPESSVVVVVAEEDARPRAKGCTGWGRATHSSKSSMDVGPDDQLRREAEEEETRRSQQLDQ